MAKRKAKAAKRRSPRVVYVKPIVAVAWYEAEQWTALLEASVDRESLELTHEEWRVHAEEAIEDLTRAGVVPTKVLVDVEDLVTWCKEEQREVDGDARATYAAKLLHDQNQ